MAFSYDWHSDAFSYKEKDAAAGQSGKKGKKKKNQLNGLSDTPDSDAIESASKKLKLCAENSCQSKNQEKNTVESLLTNAVTTSQIKSAIKTGTKSKQCSVSFADDAKFKTENSLASASSHTVVAKNSENLPGFQKKPKKKKIGVQPIGHATTASSNTYSSAAVASAPLNGKKSDADSATLTTEPINNVGSVLKRKKKAVAIQVTDAKPGVDDMDFSKKKRKIDIPANSPPIANCSTEKMSSKTSRKNSSDENKKAKDSTIKKKTIMSNDDDWEDLDSDADWDSVDDDDDDEVLDYSNEEEPELDEKFYSDLKSLIAELNFDAVRKQMDLEDDENIDMEEETTEKSDNATDDEANTNDSNEDCRTSDKEKSEMELESAIHSSCEGKSDRSGNLEDNSSSKKSATSTSMAAQKISASLAKFGMPVGEHVKTFKSSLAQKMTQKLNVAKFRMINEQLYKTTGEEAQALFRDDPESFHVYHEGFKSQVALWPLKPLDIIVDWLKLQDNSWTVADFGCGEGELADRVKQKVHSLDLVALRPHITVCDMAHTPLKAQSINVAVFCLSLMGTNVSDFIKEANRTLKAGGIMKIAEVESRITNVEEFVANVHKFGFKCWKKPVNHSYFVSFDFKKVKDIKNRPNLPVIKLKPCLYKKR